MVILKILILASELYAELEYRYRGMHRCKNVQLKIF